MELCNNILLRWIQGKTKKDFTEWDDKGKLGISDFLLREDNLEFPGFQFSLREDKVAFLKLYILLRQDREDKWGFQYLHFTMEIQKGDSKILTFY